MLVFATGDLATQTPGGVIRVVGDVAATGFADEQCDGILSPAGSSSTPRPARS